MSKKKSNKPKPYIKELPPHPGWVWVMTGVTAPDWKGLKHPTGTYFAPEEVYPCSYCENKNNALKSSIRTIGKLTTKPMCYPCYMAMVCPESPPEKVDNNRGGSWGSDDGDQGSNKIRCGKNRHICNSPLGESKTKWDSFDY